MLRYRRRAVPLSAVSARLATTPEAFVERHIRPVRSRAWLAVRVWFVSVLVAALAFGLLLSTISTPVPGHYGFRGFTILYALANATVGALIARRQPRNPVAWLWAIAGVSSALMALATEYAVFTLIAHPGILPGGVGAAWLASWVWIPMVGAAGAQFLLFPGGALPSPRWRIALGLIIAATAATLAAHLVVPGPLAQFEFVDNPFTVPGVSALAAEARGPTLLIAAVLTLAGAGALIQRYRHEALEERRQIRLVVTAIAVFAVILVLDAAFRGTRAVEVITVLAGLAVPLTTGVAILRYRLYEIDSFIGRAIVYGALTAILAGAYTATVALFQRLFIALTGESSDAAIVVTTLLLVSAFTPVKNWLQAWVDRTFNAPGSAKGLRTYVDQVRTVLQVFDRQRLVEGFLEESIAAANAGSGIAELSAGDGLRRVRTAGDWRGVECLSIQFDRNGEALGRIALGPRRDGHPYTNRSCEVLQAAADAVAPALSVLG